MALSDVLRDTGNMNQAGTPPDRSALRVEVEKLRASSDAELWNLHVNHGHISPQGQAAYYWLKKRFPEKCNLRTGLTDEDVWG